MTTLAPAKVGWCPGALRPMESGDGLIVRVKPRGGVLQIAAAIGIAELALRHGNGELELTGRANLQIRGVRLDSVSPLIEGLRGLDLLDDSAEAEAVRNVVVSPLAGLDQTARRDVRSFAATIDALLTQDPALWRLPSKWNVVIDDGGALSLRAVRADIRLEALADGSVAVGIGNAPAWAACTTDRLVEAFSALCRQALSPEPVRMAALVERRGAAAVFAAAGLHPAMDDLPVRAPVLATDLVGWHTVGAEALLGLAAPFGHLRAADLVLLLEDAQAGGATHVRLTPWRVLLLTGFARPAGLERWITPAGRRGAAALVTDRADSRLAVAACSGLPACRRATTAVREDAATLALTLPMVARDGDIAVHVSGCAKGCAHPRSAPWTLVGRDGRYDLVRNGKAGNAPVALGLTIQEVARRLSPALDMGQP